MMERFASASAIFPATIKVKPQTTPKVAAPKVSKGRSESPLVAPAGAKPLLAQKSSLGARLRTRKVTGRDASLPVPLLSAFGILVARGTVGALPQTPQGTLSLDPARGRQKGTKSPLDPFSRLSWSRFHAPSACSFLVLRLSPCLLPQLSVKSLLFFRP